MVFEVTAYGYLPGYVYDCPGYIGDTPSATVSYTKQSPGQWAQLAFGVDTSLDTVLFIRERNTGRIWCDDDSRGNGNPLVVIGDAQSGVYDIYVGLYQERERSYRAINVRLEFDDAVRGGSGNNIGAPQLALPPGNGGFAGPQIVPQ